MLTAWRRPERLSRLWVAQSRPSSHTRWTAATTSKVETVLPHARGSRMAAGLCMDSQCLSRPDPNPTDIEQAAQEVCVL